MKTKHEVIVSYKYVCDILNKEISVDDVHVIYDPYVISKEAVARLPAWFNTKERLRALVTAMKRFTPEDLHKGIWVISTNRIFNGKDNKSTFQSIDEAILWITNHRGAMFSILHDGMFVKSVKVINEPVLKVIEEVAKPKTLGQLRDEFLA